MGRPRQPPWSWARLRRADRQPRHAGQLTVGTSQIRYVGGHVYVYDDLGVYRAQDLTNTGNDFIVYP